MIITRIYTGEDKQSHMDQNTLFQIYYNRLAASLLEAMNLIGLAIGTVNPNGITLSLYQEKERSD